MNPPENPTEAPSSPPSVLDVLLSKMENPSPAQIVDAMRTMDATGIKNVFKLAEQQQPELYVAILREILHRKEEQMPNLIAIVENMIHESLDRDLEFGRMDGTIFLFFLLRQKEKSPAQQTLLEPLLSLFQDGHGPLFVSRKNPFFDENLKTEIKQFHTVLRTFAQDLHHAPRTVTPQAVSRLREIAVAFEQKMGKHVREHFADEFFITARVAHRHALYAALGPGKENNSKAFDLLLKYCTSPLPEDQDVPPASREEVRRLRNAQSDLLLIVLSPVLESMQWNADKTLDPSQRSAILDPLLTFATEREKLTHIVDAKLPKELLSAKGLALGAGFLFNYAFMKAESVARFKRPFSFYKVTAEGFRRSFQIGGLTIRGVDRVFAFNLMNSIQRAHRYLGSKAPPPHEVFKKIWKSPMGKNMFAEMMTIHSPLTVGFFAIYLHISPNKIKAAMELAGMMMVCAGVNAGARLAYYLVLRHAGNCLGKTALLRLLKFCRHPVGALIVITILLFPESVRRPIDRFFSYLDGFIPEGECKRDLGNILCANPWFPVFLLEYGNLILRDTGWIGVDPETDCFDVILEEMLGWNGAPFLSKLKRFPVNGEEQWNNAVDERINNLQNSILGRRFKREKIDHMWYARQAYLLATEVNTARYLQKTLEPSLRGGQAFTGVEDFLNAATRKMESGERNDHFLEDFFHASETHNAGFVRRWIRYCTGPKYETTGIVKDFEHSSDDDLKQTWQYYKGTLRMIARRVTALQRLRSRFDQNGKIISNSYREEEWIPQPGGKTPRYEEGQQQEFIYRIAKLMDEQGGDLYYYESDGTPPSRYGRDLALLYTPKGVLQLCKEYNLLDAYGSWVSQPYNVLEARQLHREALSAVAEAAALYARNEAEVNMLLTALRDWHDEHPVDRHKIPWTHALKIRDILAAKVRTESEGRTPYVSLNAAGVNPVSARAVRDLFSKSGVTMTNPDHVFVLCDVDRTIPQAQQNEVSSMPFFYEFFGGALKKEIGHNRIILLHQVMPRWSKVNDAKDKRRSAYNLMMMAMTCIECDGTDPQDWMVRTYRAQVTSAPRREHLKAMENSPVELLSFHDWSKVHEHAVRAIRPTLLRMQTRSLDK